MFFCLLYSYGALIHTMSLSIHVPEIMFEQHASLMLYLQDQSGDQFVGAYSLSDVNKSRTISEKELAVTSVQAADRCNPILDLTNQQSDSESVIVVHFQRDVTLLKVLVVKESFLEEDPFGILMLPIKEQEEFDQNHHTFSEFDSDEDPLDAITFLAENADTKSSDLESETSTIRQCMLYVEIYMLMQYGKLKRSVQSWWS